MRTRNSFKNICISILTQIVITILGFVSRKVFIDSLGVEYLGVNGLLTNILSMLSLVEGGIGVSIVYSLYKPLAEDDRVKIIALVQLYKKLYGLLAIGIFILSLGLYPFLGLLIKDGEGIPNLVIVYFIFIFKNMISYLNAHKWSLISADQKGYILAKYSLIFSVITTVCKIIVLQITKNYILFLLIEALIFVFQNVWNGKIVNERYSYIRTKEKIKVDEPTKKDLVKNVKAMFLHNIGTYCVFGTDNLLIAGFISVKAVGLYSNYTMVIAQLGSLLAPILDGIGASVGNLIATESKEKSFEIFNVIYLINFWIYSFCVIFLYNLLEPFINWWLGGNLLLDRLTFIVILINFYITGLRSCVNIFKSKAGIFSEDKYVPIIEAIVNLGTSIILVKYLGLAGIFIGTTISTIALPLWIAPKLVYKKVFDKSVFGFFKKYFFYIELTIVTAVITNYTCNIVVGKGLMTLIIKGIICVIIPNLIYMVILFKTKEFSYILSIIKLQIRNMTIFKKLFKV